jgi:hypothetical protein
MQRIVAGIDTIERHLEAVRQTPKCIGRRAARIAGSRSSDHTGTMSARPTAEPGRFPSTRYRSAATVALVVGAPVHVCRRASHRARWYDWSVQQAHLERQLSERSDQRRALGSLPDRRTAGRWWDWLQKSSLLFEFHLRARCAELGRAADFGAFWRRVFESMGLVQAMTLLDQELNIP